MEETRNDPLRSNTEELHAYLGSEELGEAVPDGTTDAGRPDAALIRADRRGRARVWGAARAVALRTESIATGINRQVLSFRVELYDEGGSRRIPVPVEMRGVSLRGQVSEGEQVEAQGTFRRGILIADRATNMTTGAVVGVPPSLKWGLRLGIIVMTTLLAFLGSWMWRAYRQSVQLNEIFERELRQVQSAPLVPSAEHGPSAGEGV